MSTRAPSTAGPPLRNQVPDGNAPARPVESAPRVTRTKSNHSVTSVASSTSARLKNSHSHTTLRRIDTGSGGSTGGGDPPEEGIGIPSRPMAPHLHRSSAESVDYDEADSLSPPRSPSGPSVDGQEPTATVFSCVVNLCNTILGSGILAMPTAMASVGLLLGSWIILFSAAASALGLFFLGYCARFVEGRHASFFTVSQLTYPGASLFFDLAIAIKCFGVSISYLIIFGEVMPQVMSALFIPEPLNVVTYAKTDPSFLFLLLTDRRFWITLAILLLTPLAFLRRLDSLRYTSMVALVALLYLVVIVLVNFLDPARTPVPAGRVSLIKLSPQFFTNLPIFVFAFTCHQNIFSVYNELRDNSPRNIKGTIHLAISVATVAYLIVAILGYLQFGDDVLPNIILMYHSGPLVTLGQVAIGVLMLLSYPLQCHPCRACLDKIICGYVLPRFQRPKSLSDPNSPILDGRHPILGGGDVSIDAGSTLLPNGSLYVAQRRQMETAPTEYLQAQQSGYAALQDDDEDGLRVGGGGHSGRSRPLSLASTGNIVPPAMSRRMFIAVTICILFFSYLVAMSVSQLDLVLSFVGSTGSTTISFILPGLFFYKIHQRAPMTVLKFLSMALVVYGCLVMSICLTFNIVRLFSG